MLKDITERLATAENFRAFQRTAETAPGLFLIAHGELMASLRTSAGEDPSSVFGLHSLPEAMFVLSFSVAWLKCSFHINDPLRV